MSVRWTDDALKAVGWTGTGFGNRRRVFERPDGSLVDSRGEAVPKIGKKDPEPATNRPLARSGKKSVREPVLVQANAVAPPTRSKYRNIRTGGYASKREADRAAELKLLEAGGQIRNLREQVDFELLPKQDGERAVKYRADFCYDERDSLGHWHPIVEDKKGMKTQHYVLKRKLLLFRHGIRIRET